MSQRLKIVNIVGARPNLPKIALLILEMQHDPEIEPILRDPGLKSLTFLGDKPLRSPCPSNPA